MSTAPAEPPRSDVGTAAEGAPAAEPGAAETAPALGRRIAQPRTLIGFAIALAALYFAFKRGFALDFREVWARMRGANGGVLFLALAVYYTTFFFRSYRWQVLLANVGYSRAAGYAMPSLAGLGEILYLSWFANCVTVARLGDAYRGYMLKRNANVSFVVTMGTILAERLVDIIVLAGMMAISAIVAFRGRLPSQAQGALIAGLVLSGVGLVGLLALRRLRPIVEWFLPARFHHHYAGFEDGVVGSFRRVPLLVGLSVIGWAIEGATLYLTALAIGAPLSIGGAIVVALVGSLLTTVPFTPAGVGFSETGMVLALTQLGLDPTAAGAVALLNRAINYWSIVVFGAVLYVFSRKK